jgi:hypothetical protein
VELKSTLTDQLPFLQMHDPTPLPLREQVGASFVQELALA